MTFVSDLQKLDPGEWVELFELDATNIGADVRRFHGYHDTGVITFQGLEYHPWAIEAKGFAITGDGQQPSPTLSVGNIGADAFGEPIVGVISALCYNFNDLVGARVTRRRTLAHFLDGAPDADPTQEAAPDIFLVEQKSAETSEVVTFLLSNPINFQGKRLPGRPIVASVCPWLWIGGYRGPNCGYTGSAMFDRDGNPVADPALDKCSGKVGTGCKPRFAAQQGVSQEWAIINFGGFPAADRLARG